VSRTEWILGGVLGALILAIVVGLLLFWFQGQPASEGEAEELNNLTELTAQSAFGLAGSAAQSWAADAALVSARATWGPGVAFETREASWTFTFYSPAAGRVALVSVTGGRANLLNSRETTRTFPAADLDRWEVDSPAALETVLSRGGQAFIDEQGGASVVLSLDAQALVWQGTIVNTESRRTFILQLDAQRGEVIEVQQSE
jgi:hypothetical protein